MEWWIKILSLDWLPPLGKRTAHAGTPCKLQRFPRFQVQEMQQVRDLPFLYEAKFAEALLHSAAGGNLQMSMHAFPLSVRKCEGHVN